jgi:glucan biosynthesis protein C
MTLSNMCTPLRLWIAAFVLLLVVGAISTHGETITAFIIVIALITSYGRYLDPKRNEAQKVQEESEEKSIAGHETTTCTGSTGASTVHSSNIDIDIDIDIDANTDADADTDTSSTTSSNIHEISFGEEQDKQDNGIFYGYGYDDSPWDGLIDLQDVDLTAHGGIAAPPSLVNPTPTATTAPRPKLRKKKRKRKSKKTRRLHFLDNLKVFLIFLLVTCHVACAFGAGDLFYFAIGDYSNNFQKSASVVLGLIQSFGASLFFFVSGYLVPAGYERHGREAFMLKRARNILIPALKGCFFVVPICVIIGQLMGGVSISAYPNIGHFWYSFWLLLLTWVYASLCESTTNLPFSSAEIPSTRIRMLTGFGVCGFAMFLVALAYQIIGGNVFFASMPLTISSLICHIFMFYMGVVGYRNSWLERPIRDQLDISIWQLHLIVALEAVLLVCTLPMALSSDIGIELQSTREVAFGMGAYLVAGAFCLDMSIVVLDFFQRHAASKYPVLKGLLDSAHIVYVMHPLVISLLSWGFVAFYNFYVGLYTVSGISFATSDLGNYAVSKSTFIGPGNGAVTLLMAFQCVLIMTHAVVWPLARFIRRKRSDQRRTVNSSAVSGTYSSTANF